MGKMVVRDSGGASRAWDDFGVRFVELGELAEVNAKRQESELANASGQLQELLEQYLEQPTDGSDIGPSQTCQYHKLFLSRMLSAHSLSPHETFLHPVACVIAISSSLPAPIDSLRHLYAQTAQGNKTLPGFVNPEYLRYYVLVHDEDKDDFGKSSALFDQMKRHFGLHCHLLRLRSHECLPSDEDSVELPPIEWLSPLEDLGRLQDQGLSCLILLEKSSLTFFLSLDDLIDIASPPLHLFESDVTAIKGFVRELIAQSIVPHMENRVAFWNEQFASPRRGISGRFMSLSKKWTGFGTGSRNTSMASGIGGGTSGHYDSLQGSYYWDTPEAKLRKLADYAFMLRDYKLASSTYELLRSDYGNDKAWKYLAGANEMCAVSSLLNPLSTIPKTRLEGLDQMLETASYSYLARCSDRQSALRTMTLGVELLKVRGRVAAEMASKWAIRILELGLVGSVGHVLISERVASCFSAQAGMGSSGLGSRKRKAALWNVVSAGEWMKLGKADFAAERLDDADVLYSSGRFPEGSRLFGEMSSFLEQLELAVRIKLGQARQRGLSDIDGQLNDAGELLVEETSEQLDIRSHRRSLMGTTNPLDTNPISPARIRTDPFIRDEEDDFGSAPLSPVQARRKDLFSRDDDFE
jgi:trafficking protein particle complex subunit 8